MVVLPKLMRRHIPSGIERECKWAPAQHPLMENPDYYSQASVDQVTAGLVAKWNRQQPGTWHYWLEHDKQGA